MASQAQFEFGVIADIQTADINDGTSYDGKQHRHYRASFDALKAAVRLWNEWPTRISFIANLGDAIDEACARQEPRQSEQCIAAVAEALMDECTATDQFHHCVGNHELYNFPRRGLRDGPAALRCGVGRSAPYSYHSFTPVLGWRILILDPYEIGVIGWSPDEHPNVVAAWEILDANNKNDCRTPGDWMAGMSGNERRFVPFSGGVGEKQLAWIREEMVAARDAGERVLVLTHVSIKPGACVASCCVWNYAEVLDALRAGGPGRCVAVFAGHDHNGGYTLDSDGVHHVTLPSPLVAPPPEPCHAVVQVNVDQIVVRGFGTLPSRRLAIFGLDAEGRRDAAAMAKAHRCELTAKLASELGFELDACRNALEVAEGSTDAAVRNLLVSGEAGCAGAALTKLREQNCGALP